MPGTKFFASIDTARIPSVPLHLAIGMFDGIHLGHAAVIEAAVQSARRSGGVAGVLTFFPHPSALFRPDVPTRLLMLPHIKRRRLIELGADLVIEQPFTPEYAATTAEDFLPALRRALPTLAAVYVGENWRFGRGRTGDVSLLLRTARPLGVTVFSAERVRLNGEAISSTRVRTHLEAGEIEQANELLGYSYFAEGTVVSGDHIGHRIGFPTLNLPWQPELPPRFGVYFTRIRPAGARDAEPQPAISNYGMRPTVTGDAKAVPRLETHVLVPTQLTAGSEVHVEWLHFCRPERRFDGLDSLRTQIAHDVATARAWHGLGA